MEDLREVGEKVITAIKNRKPVDAGDLAIGIGNIIEELRGQPENYEEKVNHLEGLFRELAYGEEYALRQTEKEEEKDLLDQMIAAGKTNPIMSGTVTMPSINNPIAVSGWFNPIGQAPQPMQTGFSMSSSSNPCGEVPLGEPEEISLPMPEPEPEIEEVEEEPKEFKPAWWKSKV